MEREGDANMAVVEDRESREGGAVDLIVGKAPTTNLCHRGSSARNELARRTVGGA